MKGNRETIQYFNILKCLAIFLVVFCHMTMLKNDGIIDNIFMLFCWICVPCFFMVNGALLFNKNLDIKKHLKKTLMIYVVNLVWRLIYGIIAICFLKLDITNLTKIDILEYLFLFGRIKGINTDHMYFIEALLGIYLIFPVLYQSFKNEEGKKSLIILCICLFVFAYGINASNFLFKLIGKGNDLSISGVKAISLFGQYAHFLLFFILGAFLHSQKHKIEKIKKIRIISFVGIILGLLGLVFIKYTLNHTFRWEGIYLEKGYGRFCTFIMSISTFVFVQNIFIKNKYIDKIINEIGGSTLGIYYMHVPLLVIFNKYLYGLIKLKGVTVNIIKTIVIILISYGLTKIIKKISVLKKMVI